MIGNKKIWTTTNRNIKVRTVSTKLNKLLWLAASVTSIVTVIISMYFPIFKESSSLMLALIIIGISIMLTIVRFTNQGIRSWYFLCDARLEMRKIVWPTRQETVNLTLTVLAIVVISSFLIYFMGLLFMYAIRWILI